MRLTTIAQCGVNFDCYSDLVAIRWPDNQSVDIAMLLDASTMASRCVHQRRHEFLSADLIANDFAIGCAG